MSNEPKRVLHVLGTTNLGGAESRVMELYRSIDREKIQFDFLIHTEKEGHYTKEILVLGGRIYSVPRFKVYNIT
ncbi:MAG: glycosyltransferase family 1 protein, partial [Lachnospiraceae bacterium]|nr:glycosyltransferase family 1 protein [Lachnospiraceae bacterium]